MTLSTRLNLIIGCLLMIAVVALSALLFVRASSRSAAEEKAMLRAAEFILQAAVPRIRQSQDPDPLIAAVLAELRGLRHVTVVPEYRRPHIRQRNSNDSGGFVDWVAQLLSAEKEASNKVRIDFSQPKASIRAVNLLPNPADEMAEIVAEGRDILLVVFIAAILLFLVTAQLVKRSLSPVYELQQAIEAMRNENYKFRFANRRSPELGAIAEALDELARSLERSMEKNKTLSMKLVSAQDQERNEIARELHDEMGANLFGIRARAVRLHKDISTNTDGAEPLLAASQELLDQLDDLQLAHRHVLQRFAPSGLRELGLAKALAGLVEQWRKDHPKITFKAKIAAFDRLSDVVELTVFRIVQEGVTNALKHAKAGTITIDVGRSPGEAASTARIHVNIEDDGTGMPRPPLTGFGLNNMEKRLSALGGRLSVDNIPGGGTHLRAQLPRHCNADDVRTETMAHSKERI